MGLKKAPTLCGASIVATTRIDMYVLFFGVAKVRNTLKPAKYYGQIHQINKKTFLA